MTGVQTCALPISTFITNTLQKGRKNEVNFSKDEIITIVDMSEKEGVIQAKESILIKIYSN